MCSHWPWLVSIDHGDLSSLIPRISGRLCVDLSSPVSTNGVQMFVERSRSFPLDIVLYSPEQDDTLHAEAPLVTRVMQVLNPERSRWRSLKLHLNAHKALCATTSNFCGVAESLEELVIEGNGTVSDFFGRHQPVFRMAMPAIQHLQISGGVATRVVHDIKWITKMQGLKSLTLTGSDGDITWAAFLVFLRNISAKSTLEVLELGGDSFRLEFWNSWESDLPVPGFRLPRLEEIRYINCSPALVGEVCATYIEAPSLKIIDFITPPDHTPHDVERYFMEISPPSRSDIPNITKRFPELHTFRFTGPHLIGSYTESIEFCEHLIVCGICNITWTLDQLGKFHDTAPCASDLSEVLRDDSLPVGGWFCPRLLSLEIYHCDGLNPSQLRDALATRQGATGPGSPVNAISSIIVHDEQELPRDDRAWFEANLVTFQWVRSGRPTPAHPS